VGQSLMRFCIRREIDFSNSEERLKRVQGVPIEISLKPPLKELLENRHWLMDVTRQIKQFNNSVQSVHAPHVFFSDEFFRNGARLIIAFAEAIGSDVVVLHPERGSKETRKDEQREVLKNLKLLQEHTRVKIAIETFWDDERVLTPDEIMVNHLHMVLDTSHIPKPEITWIIESYRTHLVNVHLSAVTQGGEQHLAGRKFRPVENDPFCLDVLDRLYDLGWNGVVTLEYLPWLSDKSVEDRKLLESIYRDAN
jgi:sugar phosphate isomerase/epimerase